MVVVLGSLISPSPMKSTSNLIHSDSKSPNKLPFIAKDLIHFDSQRRKVSAYNLIEKPVLVSGFDTRFTKGTRKRRGV
jgi:hypothetical protein